MNELTANRINQVENSIKTWGQRMKIFKDAGLISKGNQCKYRMERFQKELELLKKPDLKEWSEFVTGGVNG